MKKSNGLGVAVGLILWGCILFLFPLLTGISGALSWVFADIALALLLIGGMSACIEIFGEEK